MSLLLDLTLRSNRAYAAVPPSEASYDAGPPANQRSVGHGRVSRVAQSSTRAWPTLSSAGRRKRHSRLPRSVERADGGGEGADRPAVAGEQDSGHLFARVVGGLARGVNVGWLVALAGGDDDIKLEPLATHQTKGRRHGAAADVDRAGTVRDAHADAGARSAEVHDLAGDRRTQLAGRI